MNRRNMVRSFCLQEQAYGEELCAALGVDVPDASCCAGAVGSFPCIADELEEQGINLEDEWCVSRGAIFEGCPLVLGVVKRTI